MKRGLLPWLLPVAILVALLLAATNSTIVYGAVLIVAGWVIVPLLLWRVRKAGAWPGFFGDRSDPNRRRFWGI